MPATVWQILNVKLLHLVEPENIIQTEVNLFLAGFTHLEPLCGVGVQIPRMLFFLEKTFAAFKGKDAKWNAILKSPVHVLLSRFYPDFIQILSR